jgi:hypothetical protein
MEHNRSTTLEIIDEASQEVRLFFSRMGKKGAATGKGSAKSKAKTRRMLEVRWPKKKPTAEIDCAK